MEELEQHQQNNLMLADQLNVLIEQIHGKMMPFILIMPPEEGNSDAQMVTNLDSVKYIQKTLRKLDVSLSKVKKLQHAHNPVQ